MWSRPAAVADAVAELEAAGTPDAAPHAPGAVGPDHVTPAEPRGAAGRSHLHTLDARHGRRWSTHGLTWMHAHGRRLMRPRFNPGCTARMATGRPRYDLETSHERRCSGHGSSGSRYGRRCVAEFGPDVRHGRRWSGRRLMRNPLPGGRVGTEATAGRPACSPVAASGDPRCSEWFAGTVVGVAGSRGG